MILVGGLTGAHARTETTKGWFMRPEGDMSPLPSSHSTGTKRAYRSPEFRVYGDLTSITLALGGTVGKNDGGAGKDKTGFP